MTVEELHNYKLELKTALGVLNLKRVLSWNIFQKRCIKTTLYINILTSYIDFLENHLIMTISDEYEMNILEYCDLIKYSETINKILKTNYKPTFLLDKTNNKSILDGGY